MATNTKPKKMTKKQAVQLLHANGYTSAEIKDIVYPDQAPAVADASLSRALKDNNVKHWIADGFIGVDLTLRELIEQYKEELTATKAIYFKGDLIDDVPDYSTRQKARDALLKLMQAFVPAMPDPTPPSAPITPDGNNTLNDQAKRAMLEAIKNGDIKAIERIVFRDGS